MKMNRRLLVAVTIAIGTFLQGLVYVLLDGYQAYLKQEFNSESHPVHDRLISIMPTIGFVTAAILVWKDKMGHRHLLVISSLLYLFCSAVMLWSRVLTLVLSLAYLYGFACGFSYLVGSCYIAGTIFIVPWVSLRPWLPSLFIVCGMNLCDAVAKNLQVHQPRWRLMIGASFILSLVYSVLVLYLPECPKWLVRKGRIDEARQVLRMLLDRNDIPDDEEYEICGIRLGGGGGSIEEENYNDEKHDQYGPKGLTRSKLTAVGFTATQQASIENQTAKTLMEPLLTTGDGDVERDTIDSLSGADASLLTIRVAT